MHEYHGIPHRFTDLPVVVHGQRPKRRWRRFFALFCAWFLITSAQPLEAEAQRGKTELEEAAKQQKRLEKEKKSRPKAVKSDRFVPFEKIKADSAIAFPVDI